ncbi:IclR family transcriptional regulator [Deinococcus humi]|uniref:IclR family acetate operon transcriptional repressor n=1 Tax=Deinococcus humi TaxID=662880 RepID=A0A7W8NES4_9DEIO|nr:IclR family transcriptional regulator [Deinococcus humi]MBB5362970.1 IclR family acetate operon transcriptional repressor [Deinococcus humi]GGO25364.1 IclR family transcriptional regulator [Deinococcus humi]
MSENVQSVERALDIINTIVAANRSLSVGELSQAMGLAPSTIHRILQTLTVKNYVFQDTQTKRYDIGPEIVDISSALYLRYDLVRRVRPYLQELVESTGETAHIAQLYGTTAMYLSQVEPFSMVRMFTTPGSVAPLHCSDVGKVFLADLPTARVDEIIRKTGLPARTPHTITDEPALLAELMCVRAQAYALDDEEREVGVRCLSAGILNGAGKVVAAIGVAGPTSRLSRGRIGEVSDAVVSMARRCADELIRQPTVEPVAQ